MNFFKAFAPKPAKPQVPELTKISAPTASQVTKELTLQPASQQLLTPQQTPTQFMTGLQENKPRSSIAGAVVTADDSLVLAAGSELLAYDAEGRGRILFDFKGETLRTPPIINARGDLLVASETAVHCLRAK